jgi:hypothetical protein
MASRMDADPAVAMDSVHGEENAMRDAHIYQRDAAYDVAGTRVSLDSIVYAFLSERIGRIRALCPSGFTEDPIIGRPARLLRQTLCQSASVSEA